ncbi:MAG: transposase [Pseudomonadota bacterium]
MGKINNYDEEFRRNAVDLYVSSGKPQAQVARELGISTGSLRSWTDRLLDQSGDGKSGAEVAAETAGMSGEQIAAELRRLRKENEYLKRQRDILKKAALILGEDPR